MLRLFPRNPLSPALGVVAATLVGLGAGGGPVAGQAVLPLSIPGFGALGVHLEVQEEHVAVEAQSMRDLLQRLEADPGWGIDGVQAHAVTLFALAPRWGLRREEDRCVIEDPWVETDIVIRMPRWVNNQSASSSDQGSWREYRRALLAHEHAHRDITVEGAAHMVTILREATAPTCPRLVERVRGMMRRARAEIDSLHAELDEGRPRRPRSLDPGR